MKLLAFKTVRTVSIVFEAALLAVVWIDIGRALLYAGSNGREKNVTIAIVLAAGLLLLLAAAPFEDNFDPRFRIPAIPFLAMVAGLGWFSREGSPVADQTK